MKLKIKNFKAENYKCFDEANYVFTEKNSISGKNGSGKSTIMNACMEILTGKNSDGTMPDDIRPIKNGAEVPRVDIIREIGIDIDGEEHTIRKITKQKWKKPRGAEEEVFDGNVTSYEVDGFPTSGKDYASFIEKIVKPETLLLCSNANTFLSILDKSTADARKTLETISGFDLNAFIKNSDIDYSEIADITKGHSVEDTLKKLKKEATQQKKSIEKMTTEIKYEMARKPYVGSDLSDIELQKSSLKKELEKLTEIESAFSENAKLIDSLSAEIISLNAKKSEMELSANSENSSKRQEVNLRIGELKNEVSNLEQGLRMATEDVRYAGIQIEKIVDSLHLAKEEYTEVFGKEFDDTILKAYQNKEFDDSSLVCPVCGQDLPIEMQLKQKNEFEADRKRNIEKQLLLKQKFYKDKEETIKSIIKNGNNLKKRLDECKAISDTGKKKSEEFTAKIRSLSAEINALAQKIVDIPEKIDISNNEEYRNIVNKIAMLKGKIKGIEEASVGIEKVRFDKNELIKKIAFCDATSKNIENLELEKEERIADMKDKLSVLNQTLADIERKYDIVLNFSITKNNALSDIVNSHMRGFKFQLLDYTQDGGIYETCRMIRDGIDYFSLNYSDQLIVRSNMLYGFQEMSNVNLPIWVDNAESVNDGRLPNLDCQMMYLKVSEDRLKVEAE